MQFKKRLKHGLKQGGIVIDQLINWLGAPLSFETWADETISSRCGRLGHRNPYKVYKIVIDWIWEHILRLGPNHCVNAYEKEKARYNSPPEMRNKSPDQAA